MPDNVETGIQVKKVKNPHDGIKTFVTVFKKYKLTGQSEHVWEDCSIRHVDLRYSKL